MLDTRYIIQYVTARKCILNTKRELIPRAILKDSTNDHNTRAMTKKYISVLSFPFFLTATGKKPTPTFCHSKSPQFFFYQNNPTHSEKNFHLDTSKYREIQICERSRICSNYFKTVQMGYY